MARIGIAWIANSGASARTIVTTSNRSALIGRQLWPRSDMRSDLDDIADDRDRVEHLLLHAVRNWAVNFEAANRDPHAVVERVFESELAVHLRELTTTGAQQTVKGRLTDWLGVGNLDLELREGKQVAWVELKWAKQAGTLHNCAWDAGKVAQAVRCHKATAGYLVAGAPAEEWRKDTPYRRLFGVSCFDGDALVRDYASSWRGWLRENTMTFPADFPHP